MKKHLIYLTCLFALCLSFPAKAGDNKKEKGDDKPNIILHMVDGSIITGWNYSDNLGLTGPVNIMDSPKGKKISYERDLVERIFYLGDKDTVSFTKADIIYTMRGNNVHSGVWAREDYVGRSITLYSIYSDISLYTVKERKRSFYIKTSDQSAARLASEYVISPKTANQGPTNRMMLEFYFKDAYPEFAKRIKDKEFETKETPLAVVRAWDETYGK